MTLSGRDTGRKKRRFDLVVQNINISRTNRRFFLPPSQKNSVIPNESSKAKVWKYLVSLWMSEGSVSPLAELWKDIVISNSFIDNESPSLPRYISDFIIDSWHSFSITNKPCRLPFAVRRAPCVVRRSSFVVRRASCVVRRLSCVVRRLSCAVRRLSFVFRRVSFVVRRLSFAVSRPVRFPLQIFQHFPTKKYLNTCMLSG